MQDGRRQFELLDHPFDGVFAGEVRNFRKLVAVEDGEINDSLDASLAREVERDERLRDLIWGNRIEKE
jgi:hypothetical protein